MSEYNWCHGPECHTHSTVDRVRGVKGNKVLRTRKVKVSTYGSPNNSWNWFCSHGCERDFWAKYGNQIRQIAPRTEPLETPVKVSKVKHEGHQYDWGRSRDWTETKIEKVVDSPNTNNVG